MLARLKEASRRNTFMAIVVPIFTTISLLLSLFLFAVLVALICYGADHYPMFKLALTLVFILPAVGVIAWMIGNFILDN